MKVNVVCDVGNTRIKWGLVARGAIDRRVSLPEDAAEWERQLIEWRPGGDPWTWVLASVQPHRAEQLAEWLQARGETVVRLHKASQLPLRVGLAEPDKAGIDRLLDAVAALRLLSPGRPAVLIDAGSAVTVDYLDSEHVFQGGAIFPGIDLMAAALHSYTALLPRVTVTRPVPTLPAGATVPAMQVGIYLAVAGGIREAVRQYATLTQRSPKVFFTGGQAPLLAETMGVQAERELPWSDCVVWPDQTLIGILDSVTAATQPGNGEPRA